MLGSDWLETGCFPIITFPLAEASSSGLIVGVLAFANGVKFAVVRVVNNAKGLI